jgi:hypothetical protein
MILMEYKKAQGSFIPHKIMDMDQTSNPKIFLKKLMVMDQIEPKVWEVMIRELKENTQIIKMLLMLKGFWIMILEGIQLHIQM